MTRTLDPYRESLVVQTRTVWPEALVACHLDEEARQRIAVALHANPAASAHLKYERLYTGFCREITVSPGDIHRLHAAA